MISNAIDNLLEIKYYPIVKTMLVRGCKKGFGCYQEIKLSIYAMKKYAVAAQSKHAAIRVRPLSTKEQCW
jgi:hypothetical protein